MEIETKQASLDTLAVTIQALHVNGKQMTLAVFRQLPVAEAYREDGTLEPMGRWGIVRYPIKDEGDVWLVAERGGKLYRCNANPSPHAQSVESLNNEAATLNASYDADVKLRQQDETRGTKTYYGRLADKRIERLCELESELIEWTENYYRSRATLLGLPQLFIAV